MRKLWESQGVKVSRLIRIRFDSITLPRFLRRGRWMELEKEAVQDLCRSVSQQQPAHSSHI